MSKTVDKRVVQMEFDNKQFENNIGQSMSSLNNLNKQLKDLEGVKGLEELSKATDKLNFKNAEESVDGLGKKFSALEEIAIGSLRRIGEMATDMGIKLAKSLTIDQVTAGFNEYELKMTSVQTMMNSTGESIDVVKDHLEQLNEYADKTIYSFSDMTSNIGKFTNAGVDLTTATEAMKGISNWAALAGANANEASRAMYNISQSMSGGYMVLRDWQSVKFANMATQTVLKNLAETAEIMGTIQKNADGTYNTLTRNGQGKLGAGFNLQELFNNGLQFQWLTTDVLMETMNHFSQDYGKTAEDLAKLTEDERKVYEEGKKNYVNALAQKGYSQEQIEAIIKLGHDANKAATEVKTFSMLLDTLREAVGSGWAMTFEYIFGDLEQAKVLWTAISDELGGIIGRISDWRNGMLKEWGAAGGRDAIIEGLANLWRAVKEFVKPIGEAFAEVFTGDSTASLLEMSFRFRDFAKSLSVSAKLAEGVKGTFKGLFSVIKALGRGISVAFRFAQPIVRLISKIIETILSVIGVIGNLTSGIFGLSGALSDTGSKTDKTLTTFEKLCARIEALIEPIDRFKEHMMKIFDAHWLGVEGNKIGNIINTIYESIKALTALLIGSFGAITGIDTSAFESKVIGAMDSIKYGVIIRFSEIRDFIKSIFEKIGTINPFEKIGRFLTDTNFRNEALTAGRDMVWGIAEGIRNGLSELIPQTVKNMFRTIIGQVQAIFGIASPSKAFANIGFYMMEGLAVGIIMALRPVLFPAISNLSSYLIEQFRSGEAFAKIGSIGENIVAGIGQGMVNAISLLPNPILEVVNSIISKFCEFFRIESPSKVMAITVGSMLVAGIGLGMMNGMGFLEPAIKNFSSIIKSVKAFIAPFTGEINSVKEGLMMVLNAIIELVKMVATVVTDVLGPIIKQTATYIKSLSPEEMIKLLKTIIVLGTTIFSIVETLKAFNRATTVVESFVKPIAAIGETLGSIGDLADAIRSDIKTRALRALFRDLAIVIVAMMAAIYILGKGMKEDELKRGAIAVGALAAVLGVIVIALSAIAAKSEYAASALSEVQQFCKVFISMGASLFLIAASIKKIGDANWEALNKAKAVLIGLGSFIAIYIGFIIFCTTRFGYLAVDNVWQTLLGAAGAVYLIASAFVKLGNLNEKAYGKAMGAIITISLLVGAIIGVALLSSKLNKGQASSGFKGLGMALIGLGVAVMLITNATRHMAYLAENSEYWWAGLLGIAGIIGLLAGVIAVAGKMNRAWKSLLSLAALFAAMGIVIKATGSMKPEEIQRGIEVLAACSLFMIGLMAVTGFINKTFASDGTADIGKTLLAAASAMAIMGLIVRLVNDIDNPSNGIRILWELTGMMMALVVVAGMANAIAGTGTTSSKGSWKGLKKGNYEHVSEKSLGPGFAQLIGVALALGVLAYALGKLAIVGKTYDLNAANNVMWSLSLMIGFLVGLMTIVGRTEGFKVSTVVSIGVVIAAITGALVLLATFSDEAAGMIAGAMGIALVLVGVGVMFDLLGKMPKLDMKQTLAIVEIIGVVGLITAALGYVAKNSKDMKAGPILAFGVSMVLMMTALALIFDMGSKLKIGAASAILVASLAFIPIGAALWLVGQYSWKDIAGSILSMSAALVIMAGAMRIIGGMDIKNLAIGVVGLVAITASLYFVAQGMANIAAFNWETIRQNMWSMVIAIGAFSAVMLILGAAKSVSIIGTIILLGVTVALLGVSAAMVIAAAAIDIFVNAITKLLSPETAQNFIDFWTTIGEGIPIAAMAMANGIILGIQTLTAAVPLMEKVFLLLLAAITKSLDKIVKQIEVDGVRIAYTVGQVIAKIKQAFFEGLRGDDFTTYGENIGEGLAQGINKMARASVFGGPVGAVVSLANTLASSFCKVLGISSPSWLFRLFGGFIVTGLVDGIINGNGEAFNAGKILGENAEGGFLEGASGLLNGDIAKQIKDQLGIDLGEGFSLDKLKDIDLSKLDITKMNFDNIDAGSVEEFLNALKGTNVEASQLDATLASIQNKDGTDVEIKATLDTGNLKSETDKVLRGVYGTGTARWKAMYQQYLKEFNGDTAKALQMVVDIQNSINKNAGSKVVHNLNEMGGKIGLTATEIKKAAETLSKSTEEAKKTIVHGSDEYYKQTAKNGNTINKNLNDDIVRHGSQSYYDSNAGTTINNRKTILETEKQITVEMQKQTEADYKKLLRSDQVISAEERNLAMLRIKYAEEKLNNDKITKSERDRLEAQKLTAQEVINTYNEQQKMRDVIALSTDELKKQEEAQKKVTDAAKETKAIVYGSDEYYKQTGKNGGSINKKIASEVESKPIKTEPKVEVKPVVQEVDTADLEKEVEDRTQKRLNSSKQLNKFKVDTKVEVDITDANSNLEKFDEKSAKAAENIPKNVNKAGESTSKEMAQISATMAKQGEAAGNYGGVGMANGLLKNRQRVRNASFALAREAAIGSSQALKINSPSKVMEGIGIFAGEGLRNGIMECFSMIFKASEDLGNAAIDGLARDFDSIQYVLDNVNLDYSPSIVPVIDTSMIQSGINSINNLIAQDRVTGITADMNLSAQYNSSQIDILRQQMANVQGAISNLGDAILNQPAPEVTANVNLLGDAKGVFNLVRDENKVYTNMHGRSALA